MDLGLTRSITYLYRPWNINKIGDQWQKISGTEEERRQRGEWVVQFSSTRSAKTRGIVIVTRDTSRDAVTACSKRPRTLHLLLDLSILEGLQGIAATDILPMETFRLHMTHLSSRCKYSCFRIAVFSGLSNVVPQIATLSWSAAMHGYRPHSRYLMRFSLSRALELTYDFHTV